jgi:parallel beta-helix repeat protein
VTGIRIELTDASKNSAYGTYNCSKVDNNVLIGNGNFLSQGIYNTGISSNDFIKNNYTDNWGAGIYFGGSTANTISQNIVVVRPNLGGLGSTGIYDGTTGSGPFVVQGNSLLGDPGNNGVYISSPGAHTTYRNNICDPSVAACASCSDCSTPVAPILQ